MTSIWGHAAERGETRSWRAVPQFTKALLDDATGIPALAFFNTGKFRADDPASYRAEFGAGGGITNGRALARLFAPLAIGGSLGARASSPRARLIKCQRLGSQVPTRHCACPRISGWD